MPKSVSFLFCAIKTTKEPLEESLLLLLAQSIKDHFNLQAYFSVSYSVVDIKSASSCTQAKSGGVAKIFIFNKARFILGSGFCATACAQKHTNKNIG